MEIKVFKHFPNDAMKIRQEVFVEEAVLYLVFLA